MKISDILCTYCHGIEVTFQKKSEWLFFSFSRYGHFKFEENLKKFYKCFTLMYSIRVNLSCKIALYLLNEVMFDILILHIENKFIQWDINYKKWRFKHAMLSTEAMLFNNNNNNNNTYL